jgi:hypothetical protein
VGVDHFAIVLCLKYFVSTTESLLALVKGKVGDDASIVKIVEGPNYVSLNLLEIVKGIVTVFSSF